MLIIEMRRPTRYKDSRRERALEPDWLGGSHGNSLLIIMMEMWYRGDKDLEGTAEEGGGWKVSDCVLSGLRVYRDILY